MGDNGESGGKRAGSPDDEKGGYTKALEGGITTT